MNDEHLNELLGSIEPAKPSNAFTERTLARLDRRDARQRQTRPVWVWAFSLTAIMLLVAMGIAIHLVQSSARDSIRLELLELRHEHDRLHQELTAIKTRTPESQRYVYLGESDRAGYVLDLDRWNELGKDQKEAAIPTQPARY